MAGDCAIGAALSQSGKTETEEKAREGIRSRALVIGKVTDPGDCSRDLARAATTCSRHEGGHSGKQQKHHQRHEAGGRREAREIFVEPRRGDTAESCPR
jgi:hypothetical protein